MKQVVKLSIIIPTYNSSLTINRCLYSILDLNIRIKFEILVQDGISNDNTLDLLKQFYPLPNLKIQSARDKGVYDAMNKAINRASGKWIYFLGSDDLILSEFTKALITMDDKFDVIYGNVRLKNSGKIYDGEFSFSKLAEHNICHQAVFYKKKVLIDSGGFDLKYPILADYALNLKLFSRSSLKIKYIDLILAEFAETGLSGHSKDFNFIRDKPKILEGLYTNYKMLKGYHQALYFKAENEILEGKISSGLKALWKWGRLTKRQSRSIYLIFALLKNRYFGAGN